MVREPLTLLVAGATGLVGRSLVEQLCDSPRVSRVVALARRPLDAAHAKLDVRQIDIVHVDAEVPLRADVACCTLGTTIAAAGSQDAFRRIDHDATLAFARYALACGARRFVLVSSVGADPAAANFYLRVKGEVEQALCTLPFEALVILRPGLLLGERRESRPAEAVARVLAPALNPLLVGPLAHYRAVRADRVAAAMVACACDDRAGVHVLDVPAIERVAGA